MFDWNGRRVLVIGAARQGLALTRYLVKHGARVVLNDQRLAEELPAARQTLTDLGDDAHNFVQTVFGGHPLDILGEVDCVCPSGGVPLSLPLISEARHRGIPFSNDSQIFLGAAPCKVIGITGSAGKTTTTILVGRMAQSAQGDLIRKVWVGGNIGTPLISILDEISSADLAVMELSSFQLELMTRSPQIAAVLNVTPNHLDRHASMEEYLTAKARILDFQTTGDVAVLNRDDPGSWGMAERVQGRLVSFGLTEADFTQSPYMEGITQPSKPWTGAFVCNDAFFFRSSGKDTRLVSTQEVLLPGEHNLVNALAACAIASSVGIPADAIQEGVVGFRGAPHRLEFIRTWGGAEWYNDSIATAPERVIAALKSFEEPLVLLLGGRDKNLPWGDLAALARQKVRHIILFGEAAEKIERELRAAGFTSAMLTLGSGLQDSVRSAARLAAPGDVILLSPGGTSFDEFRDFEHRGEAFRKWVMELPC